MIKKVNVKNASTVWLWLMVLPFINGFILRNRAKKIFEKKYKRIGLLCGIISILSPIMYLIVLLMEIVILMKTNPNMAGPEAIPILAIGFGIVSCVFLASYLGSIVTAFIMKSTYAYKKGVLNYANQHKVVYKDFETAENAVIDIIEKEEI